jgi:hypothetical protein
MFRGPWYAKRLEVIRDLETSETEPVGAHSRTALSTFVSSPRRRMLRDALGKGRGIGRHSAAPHESLSRKGQFISEERTVSGT